MTLEVGCQKSIRYCGADKQTTKHHDVQLVCNSLYIVPKTEACQNSKVILKVIYDNPLTD